MKGKIITEITIHENKMLEIGTEVEIVDIQYGCYTSYMCIIPTGEQISIEASKIHITDYTPFVDWIALRREFAKRAMQGILSGTSNPTNTIDPKSVAEAAIAYADVLIEELKRNCHE